MFSDEMIVRVDELRLLMKNRICCKVVVSYSSYPASSRRPRKNMVSCTSQLNSGILRRKVGMTLLVASSLAN